MNEGQVGNKTGFHKADNVLNMIKVDIQDISGKGDSKPPSSYVVNMSTKQDFTKRDKEQSPVSGMISSDNVILISNKGTYMDSDSTTGFMITFWTSL